MVSFLLKKFCNLPRVAYMKDDVRKNFVERGLCGNDFNEFMIKPQE